MTRIRTTCPSCGDVELPNDALELVIASAADRSFYHFACPSCTQEIRKTVDEHIVLLLRSGQVPERYMEIPAEALEVHDGPPLTEEDLINLMRELENLG